MYRVIRKVHLYCGLVILTFVMMYAVSGFIMTHRPWFATVARAAPTTRPAVLAESPGGGRSKEQLAADVQRQLGLVGRIQFPQKQPAAGGPTRFWVNHPGAEVRVDVWEQEQRILVTTQRERWVGKLIMLHKVAGYDAHPDFDACAFFCDLAGASMILFAFTGVYLWWKTTRNRLWGTLCLIASCAYAAGMMLYFAYAP